MRLLRLRGSFPVRSRCSLSMACWTAWGRRSRRVRNLASGSRPQAVLSLFQGFSFSTSTLGFRPELQSFAALRLDWFPVPKFCGTGAEARVNLKQLTRRSKRRSSTVVQNVWKFQEPARGQEPGVPEGTHDYF